MIRKYDNKKQCSIKNTGKMIFEVIAHGIAFANADPAPFISGTQDANELVIFAERSNEFVYEGKRWYDIRRMKYGSDPLVTPQVQNRFIQ